MSVGERIKSARLKAGMTQSELAKKLGIPYQSIGQWERNERNPKQETLEKIFNALGVSKPIDLSFVPTDDLLKELKRRCENGG